MGRKLVSVSLSVLQLALGCNYDEAAIAMFGQDCAALMASPEASYCIAGHAKSPYIAYFCGDACGTAAAIKALHPTAYEDVDHDWLFQQVEQQGLFSPGASYAYYANYADMDADIAGKQVYYRCDEVEDVALFWQQPLSIFCDKVFSVVCPQTYLSVCQAKVAAVANVPMAEATCLADEDPCFPSAAMVTKADGTATRLLDLKEGDEIVAASETGTLTTDIVSLLSIAQPEAVATFVNLTTAAGTSLLLTADHHLPVGSVCCSTLKKSKDVTVGETVSDGPSPQLCPSSALVCSMCSERCCCHCCSSFYPLHVSSSQIHVVNMGVRMPVKVAKITMAQGKGRHSPVLTHGGFPVVNNVVTSFDSIGKVR